MSSRPGTVVGVSNVGTATVASATPQDVVQLAPGQVTSAAIADGAVTLTDLDPAIRGNVQNAITSTVVTARGQMIVGLGDAAVGTVPTGTDGQVLTVNSAEPGGVQWATPAAGSGNASTTSEGVVRLAGDLAGTATNVRVTGTHLAAPLPVAQGGTGAASTTAALTALGAAPVDSPTFTGTPRVPTATSGSSTAQAASTQFVAAALNGLPATFATNAAAVHKTGDETVAGVKAFTTSPTAPTPPPGDNTTKVATTAFVRDAVAGSPATVTGTTAGNAALASLIAALAAKGIVVDGTTAGSGDTPPPVGASVPAPPAATTATVTASTNEASVVTVDYGTTVAYGSTATGVSGVLHTITLTGLTASTMYHYRVRATDTAGNVTTGTDSTFTTTATPAGPAAVFLDGFNGDTGAAWSAPWTTLTATTAATATMTGTQGRLNAGTLTGNAGVIVQVLSGYTLADADITFAVTLPASDAIVDVIMRSSTGSIDNGYSLGLSTDFSPGIGKFVAGTLTVFQQNTGVSLTAGVQYLVRMSTAGSTIRARIWPLGTAEPSTWTVSATDTTYTSGGLAVRFTGATTANAVAYIDDFAVYDNGGTIGGGGGGGGGTTAASRSRLPFELGVFDNSLTTAKFDAFQSMTGGLLDFVDMHPAWGDIASSSWWYTPHQGRGYGLMVSVPMFSNINTNSSAMWTTIATNLKNAGWSNVYWRLGVEFNLANSWACTDSNYGTWKTRFQEASQAIKAVMPGARVLLCGNEGLGAGNLSQANTINVIDSLAPHYDILTCDYYDQWEPITNSSNAAARFGTASTFGSMNWYLAKAQALGKKFGLPEWGVSSGSQWAPHAGNDNPFYINYVMDWLAANRGTVAMACYFEEPASYLVSNITTAANNPSARAAFIAKCAAYRTA